jgi:hypothetical protein
MTKNSPLTPSKGQSSSKAQKLDNPSIQFNKPTEILDDPVLSKEEKKSALDTWEQDARQLMTASNEGMSGKEEGLPADDRPGLSEVGQAKSELGAAFKHKPSH